MIFKSLSCDTCCEQSFITLYMVFTTALILGGESSHLFDYCIQKYTYSQLLDLCGNSDFSSTIDSRLVDRH